MCYYYIHRVMLDSFLLYGAFYYICEVTVSQKTGLTVLCASVSGRNQTVLTLC